MHYKIQPNPHIYSLQACRIIGNAVGLFKQDWPNLRIQYRKSIVSAQIEDINIGPPIDTAGASINAYVGCLEALLTNNRREVEAAQHIRTIKLPLTGIDFWDGLDSPPPSHPSALLDNTFPMLLRGAPICNCRSFYLVQLLVCISWTRELNFRPLIFFFENGIKQEEM